MEEIILIEIHNYKLCTIAYEIKCQKSPALSGQYTWKEK